MLRRANSCRDLPAAVRALMVALAAAIAAVHPAPAFAQTAAEEFRTVDPYVVCVLHNATPMKCMAGGPFYAVQTMKTGQMLRVDGERAGWLRVEYLAGMEAFVRPNEANLDLSGRKAHLTRPSRLWAVNVVGTETGYAWNLLNQDLPTGTALEVRETLKAADGSVRGYLVAAPQQARGYVKADSVRKATAEEVQAAGQASPGLINSNGQGGGSAASVAAAPTPENTTGPIPDFDSLIALFDSAMAKTGDADELAAVMAQFKRKIDALGDAPEDQFVRTTLKQRLQALALRRDVLDALQKVRSETASASDAEH